MSSVLSTGELGNLAGRIRAGDTAAETELVHRFGRRIFVMAVVRTRDRETANELVQDVLMAVIGALRKGQLLGHEKLAAFVHGTARNLINNRLRAGSHQPQLEPLPENLVQAGHAEQLEQAERSRIVLEALEHLSPEDRRILWMTLVEGQKPGEISTALGLRPDVVRTRKLRALRKITELIRKKLSRNL